MIYRNVIRTLETTRYKSARHWEGPVMRRATIAAVAIILSIGPLWAQTAQPAPAADNLAASQQLIEVMRAADQFKAILPSLIQNMKAAVVQNRPEMEKNFDAMMPLFAEAANARVKDVTDQMATIYARHFSVDEMHAMTAFYQTPAGQKLLAEQPAIARETLAAGQQFGRAIALDIQTRALEALRKQQAN